MEPTVVLLALCAIIAGTALGTLTGLVPGIHVNTLALLMLVSYPRLEGLLGPVCALAGVRLALVPLFLACVIVSATVTHSFLDFIPSVFIGAPDEDDCLSVLPGHRLLLAGKGLVAVRSAAEGSLGGAMLALLISIPFLYLLGTDGETIGRLDRYVPGLLTVIIILIVMGQRRDREVRAVFIAHSYVRVARTSIVPVRPGIHGETSLYGKTRRHWNRCEIETSQGPFPVRYRGRLPSGQVTLVGRWVLTRRRWRPAALASVIFLLSGLLGVAVLWGRPPALGWSGLEGNMMFPLLTGLFGVPSLLSAQGARGIPEQKDDVRSYAEAGAVLSGSLAGLLAGLVPGVTSTSATVTASMTQEGPDDDEEVAAVRFIAMSAAVGTAAMVFGVMALASTGQGGTGSLMVVEGMLGQDVLSDMGRIASAHLALLFLSVLVSSLLAYHLTIWCGSVAARRSSGRSGGRMSRLTLLFVVALCLALCGPLGLLVMTAATVVGALPPALGVSRVTLTGCLLLPILLAAYNLRPLVEQALGAMP